MTEEHRWRAQAVLFDLDGVLIDSMPTLTRLLGRWADMHSIDRDLVLRTAHGRRETELISELAPWADVAEEIARMQAWQDSEPDCMPCAGAEPLLASLGRGRWAVVTSGSRNVATGRLRAARLPVPEILVSAHDVVNGKPHPEPYLLASAKLELDPSQCIVVEDAPSGVASGLRAGMRVIAIAASPAMCPDGLTAADICVGSLADIRVLENGRDGVTLAVGGLGKSARP
jgi:sugar-phosphatase